MRPYQQPHPPVWVPGVLSKNTVEWCAKNRIPYIMLATQLDPTKRSFELYDEVAKETGYEAGPQHRGYLFKVHVDETEDKAYHTGRKFIEGPNNIFLEGSRARPNPFIQNLPGLTSPHPDPADRGAVPGPPVARPGQGTADPDRGRRRRRYRRPRRSRPDGSRSTRASSKTTRSSPARPRPSSPRSATCWKRCVPGRSSSGTATGP